MFYDWYDSSLYDQTLRVNGVAQRDLLILNPGYPDPTPASSSTCSRRTYPGRVRTCRCRTCTRRRSALNGRSSTNLTAQMHYQVLRGRNRCRAVNINAPVQMVIGVGESARTLRSAGPHRRQHHAVRIDRQCEQRSPDVQGDLPDPQQADLLCRATTPWARRGTTPTAPRRCRRTASTRMPNGDRRARTCDTACRRWSMCRSCSGIRATVNVNAQSGVPYTITTGLDNNHDGVLNDRPARREAQHGARRRPPGR